MTSVLLSVISGQKRLNQSGHIRASPRYAEVLRTATKAPDLRDSQVRGFFCSSPVHRRREQPAAGLPPDGVCEIPLKLLLHELVPVRLHDLLGFHRQSLGPIRHGHREGVETVVLGEGTLVPRDTGQLEEQLIPLMVLDAVATRLIRRSLPDYPLDQPWEGNRNGQIS